MAGRGGQPQPGLCRFLGLGGSPRLRERVDEADLVVAFGPRLDDPTTDGFSLVDGRDPASVVLVSQDPEELRTAPVAGTAIHTGLAAAAAYLARPAGPAVPEPSSWCSELRAEYLAFQAGPSHRPEPDLAASSRTSGPGCPMTRS